MKLPVQLLALILILTLGYSCRKKPDACLNGVSGTFHAGDTIRVTSCSSNTDIYIWKVDNDFLNPFNDRLFGNHFVVAGGDDCENWIELAFFEAGTYSVDLTNPDLKTGSCGSSYKGWDKDREDKASISIAVAP